MKNQIMSSYISEPANNDLTDTSTLLEMAKMGNIPVEALSKMKLNQTEVSQFLARELLIWHSAAEGAKMQLLSTLFYELHISLLESAKTSKRAVGRPKLQATV